MAFHTLMHFQDIKRATTITGSCPTSCYLKTNLKP
uniref:Uncharacterized protein n=1 Tax=Siphoviridae sp. ctprd3 TaxID=2827943 RepID=A0A8S5TB02_9CAUD|nr:MAG TPA: hypothetical protein [Siphoviridae sp. ctprd3]